MRNKGVEEALTILDRVDDFLVSCAPHDGDMARYRHILYCFLFPKALRRYVQDRSHDWHCVISDADRHRYAWNLIEKGVRHLKCAIRRHPLDVQITPLDAQSCRCGKRFVTSFY